MAPLPPPCSRALARPRRLAGPLLAALALLAPWAAAQAQAVSYDVQSGQGAWPDWETPPGTTRLHTACDDGDWYSMRTWTVSLPFTFRFWDVAYTSIRVTSHGYLAFGTAGNGYDDNVALRNAAIPNGFVAPLWDTFYLRCTPGIGSSIYHYLSGTAPNRVFHVTWNRVAVSADPTPFGAFRNHVSAQVQLHETTNVVRIVYGPYDYTPGYGDFSWTAGVEGTDGASAVSPHLCSPSCDPWDQGFGAGQYYDYAPLGDVEVVSVTAPAAATVGDAVSAPRTFRNPGTLAMPSRAYRIVLSTDTVINGADPVLASGTVPALAPGGQVTHNDLFVLQNVASPGSYYLGVLLLGSDAIASNNVRAAPNATTITVPLSVTGPDSLPEAVQGLALPATGYTFAAAGASAPTWSISGGALPAGLSLGASTGKLTGTPTTPAAAPGQAFTVTASSGSASASRDYRLVVRPRLAVSTASLPEGALSVAYSVTLAATGGPDGRAWSVVSGSLPAGLSLAAATGVLSGTPTAAGSFPLTLRVTAGTSPQQQTADASLTLLVHDGLAISLPGGAAHPPDAVVGTAYALQPIITGGSGALVAGISSGSLPPGLSVVASTGAITGTPTSAVTRTFTYRIERGSQSATRTWTMAAWNPLAIADTFLPDAVAGVAYQHALQATGGQSAKTWSMTGTPPTGLAFSAGTLSGTPAAPSGANPRALTFTVTSGAQTAQKTLDLLVVTGLSLAAGDPPPAVRNQPYSHTFSASGGTGARTFSVVSGALPAGLALGSSTGTVSGTPTTAGTSSCTLRVATGSGATLQEATRAYTFVVQAPLAVTTTTLPEGLRGQSYSAHLEASGGGTGRVWGLSAGGLPAGLSLSASGDLAGTPAQTGTYPLVVRVTSAPQEATASLSLVIREPLSVRTTTLPDAVVGALYEKALAAAGGLETDRRWSLRSGALPPGITLSGPGVLAGRPTQPGRFSFTVQVASGAQTATGALLLVVGAQARALAVTTRSLAPAVPGQAYSQTLEAEGGQPPYAWTASGLPAGFSTSSAGLLSGTASAVGLHLPTFTVSDGAGATAAATLPLVVADPARVTVAAQPLPSALVGVAYEAALTAVGGAPPYTWQTTAGDLPGGLFLGVDGRLTGTTLAAPGLFRFRAQATDSGGLSGAADFALGLGRAGEVTVLTDALPDAATGTAYREEIVAAGGRAPHAFTAGEGLPPGLALDALGVLAGTPAQTGSYSFAVRAEDRDGLSGSRELTLTVAAADAPDERDRRASPCGCGGPGAAAPAALGLLAARRRRKRGPL